MPRVCLAALAGWWRAAPGALVVILGVAGCASTPARQPVATVVEPWSYAGVQGSKIVTDHFELYSTLTDEELQEALPGFLETAYEQYTSLLPPRDEVNPRMQSYVFRDRRQWEQFTRERFPGRYQVYRQIPAGGYAHGRLCVVYYLRRAYTLSVLAHEGMHQYFGSHFDEVLPAWLNEGLATYCESYDLPKSGPRFTPRRNTFRMNSLRDALIADSVIPLRKMLATDAGEVILQGRTRLTTTYYAQAWAMTVYLRHGSGGRYAQGFARMLADVSAGELARMAQSARIRAPFPSQVSYGEAVFRAYITDDLDAFETGFLDYMHELAGFKKR